MATQSTSSKKESSHSTSIVEEAVRFIDQMLIALLIISILLLLPVLASETVRDNGSVIVLATLLISILFALVSRFR
jgi:hypothetical protein